MSPGRTEAAPCSWWAGSSSTRRTPGTCSGVLTRSCSTSSIRSGTTTPGSSYNTTELRRGTKQWAGVGQDDRHRILAVADGALAGYAPVNPACRGVSSGPSRNATRAARSLEQMSSSSRTYIGPGSVVTPPVDTCAMRTQRPRDGQTSLAARLSLPSGRAQERRSGGSG